MGMDIEFVHVHICAMSCPCSCVNFVTIMSPDEFHANFPLYQQITFNCSPYLKFYRLFFQDKSTKTFKVALLSRTTFSAYNPKDGHQWTTLSAEKPKLDCQRNLLALILTHSTDQINGSFFLTCLLPPPATEELPSSSPSACCYRCLSPPWYGGLATSGYR
jgi:hypothetical protein